MIKPDPEFKAISQRWPLTDKEKAGLEADIEKHGCITPMITWRGFLLDGYHRFDICKKHHIPFEAKEMDFETKDKAKWWALETMKARRNLTPYARGEIELAQKGILAREALGRKSEGGRKGKRGKSSVNVDTSYQCMHCHNMVTSPHICKEAAKANESRRTRTKLAKAADVSTGTMHKIEVIHEAAPEEIKTKLRKGETTINKEYKQIVQKERKAKQIEQIKAAPPASGKYHVMVADPPWAYSKRSEDATHRGSCPYPTMTVEEIIAKGYGKYGYDDSILWLWTTNAFMVEAHQVAEAWGFEVKTILTWVKDRMGVGDWLRGKTEHCLMAVKGKPPIELTNQTTVLMAPMREHSRKPEEFYRMVERLCPGTKCEFFSRETRKKWQPFGTETDKFNG